MSNRLSPTRLILVSQLRGFFANVDKSKRPPRKSWAIPAQDAMRTQSHHWGRCAFGRLVLYQHSRAKRNKIKDFNEIGVIYTTLHDPRSTVPTSDLVEINAPGLISPFQSKEYRFLGDIAEAIRGRLGVTFRNDLAKEKC